MKKALSVVLALVMVLAVASFAMAATISWTGKADFEFNNNQFLNNAYGDVWAEIDYAKDLGNGWSGGMKFRIKPGADNLVDKEVPYESHAFAKYTAEMFDVALGTAADFGIGEDFVDEWKTVSASNVEANFKPMEGFTATIDVVELSKEFDFVVKGVYDLDGIKIGAGYLSSKGATFADADDKTAFGVWGSYKVMDALTVGGEYSSRKPNVGDAINAYEVKVGYAQDVITANLKYVQRDNGFAIKNDKEAELFSLVDRFWDNDEAKKGYLISVDGTYALSDTLKVGANVDMTDLKFSDTTTIVDEGKDGKALDAKDVSTAYKVYVTDTLTEGLTLEAGYKAFLASKIYVKLSLTL